MDGNPSAWAAATTSARAATNHGRSMASVVDAESVEALVWLLALELELRPAYPLVSG